MCLQDKGNVWFSSNLLINHVLMKEVAPNLEAKAEYESYKPVQQLQ